MWHAERVQEIVIFLPIYPAMCVLVPEVQRKLCHLPEMMQERGFEVHHTTIYR
jgi:hypothetical protein